MVRNITNSGICFISTMSCCPHRVTYVKKDVFLDSSISATRGSLYQNSQTLWRDKHPVSHQIPV